jgi:hypothetical protein
MWYGNGYSYVYGYPQSYDYGYRFNITSIMGCMNKWVTINFTDGTAIQAYLTSADFNQATGFLSRNSIRSVSCGGTVIQNAQQAQACMNQWVQVELPNNISMPMYLTQYEDQYIGGSFQTRALLGLSNQISGVQC